MSMTFSTATSNPHIVALEAVFAQAVRPIKWLVITHNDPRILNALSSALVNESVAVLELPQDQWNFKGQQLCEMIEWVIQQSVISHLVLAGSSNAGSPQNRASVFDSESTCGALESYSKLLTGVQRNLTRKQDAQSYFASQTQQMLQIPELHNLRSSGELCVYPLFYRIDGGFFLAYDYDLDSFHPLLS